MDFSTLKSLTIPEGEVTKIAVGDTVLWEAITYTNQVPISTDTDGSIFNGVGYIENKRLSSSGGISSSAQQGAVTTGFIPWYGDATVLRIKGVEWITTASITSQHYYYNFYDENKKFLDYIASYNVADRGHIITVTRDVNGVETTVFNQSYGTSNTLLQNIRKAKFVRITAKGKGADFIVTINEEIN